MSGVYDIICYDCGAFEVELDLSQILRRKYLCFNLDTAMGRESYDENMKIFRDYIRFHNHPTLTQSIINQMIFLRRP